MSFSHSNLYTSLPQAPARGNFWGPASHFGYETDLWTVARLRIVIYQECAIKVSKNTIWSRLYEKRIQSGEVIQFLGQMLTHHKRRHIVVVMDQARPHTSNMTKAYIEGQPRLHVFYLPKYSPDWNPDEKVRNHLKHQELKAHQAKTKPELKKLAKRKLHQMARNTRLIRGLFFRCCVANLFE